MKDKVVIWCGLDFTQFCMTYYLQKIYDCELYAIIDITDKTKKFFKTQKLVNFKKSWFLHDQYEKPNALPDIEYLKNFEQKYGFNIWKLALNERIFYGFFNFYKFSSNDILSIIEQICKFYERFFAEVKPDFFITKLTAFHHLELFRKMCIYHGVKVLMLSNPKVPTKNIISEDDVKFDYVLNLDTIDAPEKTFSQLHEDFKSLSSRVLSLNHGLDFWNRHSSASITKTLKILLHYIFSRNTNHHTHYNYYGRTKSKVILHYIGILLRVKIREMFINRCLSNNPDLTSPFVYYPLDVVLERHVLIGAPFHVNQIEVIRNIIKSLPVGYRLLVKEHPVQKSREWRSISEYKEILEIPNVTLIHPSFSDLDLIKKSSLVISIAGSSAFEAVFHQKPTLIFGDAIYSYLPCVTKNVSIESLSQDIRVLLSTEVNSKDLSKYMKVLSENLISFNFVEFFTEFLERFAFSGGYNDVEINELELENFILEKRNSLEYLSNCHLYKINQHKMMAV